jgi:hypothetical protein
VLRAAATTITSEELITTKVATVEEVPNAKWQACSFEPMKNTKEILVNPVDPDGKVLRIGSDPPPK